MLTRKTIILAVAGIVLLMGVGIIYFLHLGAGTAKALIYPEEVVFLRPFFNEPDTSRINILYQPQTVRIDSAGNVYVLDFGNNRIMKYTASGKFLQQIGGVGQGPGELLRPLDFDIGGKGELFVVEEGNQRVSIFDKDGRFLNSFSVPSFPPANICVNDNTGEILLNQPTINGALFDVYNRHGDKVRSFGLAEPFEHPFLRGPNRMATWAFNIVYAHYNSKGELDVFYKARPLFRRYSSEEKLILEKVVAGAEIDTARVYEKRNLQLTQQPNPNNITYTTFFADFDYLNSNKMLVRLTGVVNSFYVIDNDGHVIKKHKVHNTAEFKEENPLVSRFAVSKDGQVICSDQYYGTLYRIDLSE